MARFTMTTTPLWVDTAPVQRFPSLETDVEVDVAIIGGGITGLTAAYLLKQAGRSVAIVELHRVGQGESGHTTAHLTEVLDTDYKDLIAKFDLEGGRLACQSSRAAIQRIEETIRELDIDCGFKRLSAYKYSEREDDRDYLEQEAEAALKLSVPNTLTTEVPLPFKTAVALRFDHQAQFNPLHYMTAIAKTIPGNGSHIFENTRMIDIEDGEPCKVHTDHGSVTARDVIVAANVPSMNKFFLHSKLAAYRTYAIALELSGEWNHQALFWDTEDPYHYTRWAHLDDKSYLIVGGEDHKTGHEHHTEIAFQNLEDYARMRFDVRSVAYRWSGQIIHPVDGLPFIGRNSASNHSYVATGYLGNGMTFGTVAGSLLSDLVLGVDNPLAELYDARRIKPLAGLKEFFSENVDYPSHLIADRFSPADERNLRDIPEHEGRIVRIGGKKVAAYRSPEGEISLLSPVCPHLGCYVAWNEAEKSWDCPCHGSRFNPNGHLLNGPAVTDLASEMFEDNPPLATERYDTGDGRYEPFVPPLLSVFTCPFKPRTS